MAHDLRIVDGKASMFYVGTPPWHGLGTHLEKPPTAAEAIRAANLDWEVRRVPLYACEGLNNCRVPRQYAIVPSFAWGKQNCPIFGMVSENYQPLQNQDAFGFFDPIVEQNEATYHTAGALGKGERIWVLAELPAPIRIIGDDLAQKFLLLSNSHDGGSAVQIKFTPIRVVCQNTLTMALERGPTLRVAHHSNMNERLKQAASILATVSARFAEIEKAFQTMVRVQVSSDRLREYLAQVFPDPEPTNTVTPRYARALAHAQDQRRWSAELFEGGAGNRIKGVPGTLWAAYNGVTEMVDHQDYGFGANRRLFNVWFGTGYSVKARAYNVAIEKMTQWRN